MKFTFVIRTRLVVGLMLALIDAQVLPAVEPQPGPSASATQLLVKKARLLESLNRVDLAAQVWHQLLIADPNQPEALAALVRWARQNGKTAEATAYLDRLNKVSPALASSAQTAVPATTEKENPTLNGAVSLASSGHPEEAMRIYRQVFGSTPSDKWAVPYYETLAATKGGFEPAVTALKALLSSNPNATEYQLVAGRLMTYRPVSRQEGIAMLSAIADSSLIGVKARAAWRQALLWEKENPAYLQQMQTYADRNDDAELQTIITSLKARSARGASGIPESNEERLGYQALNAGNLKEAERNFATAFAKNPKSERAHAGLGFTALKASNFDQAVHYLEGAERIGHDAAVANALQTALFWSAMRRGAKAAEDGNWAEAVNQYRTANSLKPNEVDGVAALGGALVAAGASAQAIPFLTKVVRMKPADEASWLALASAKLNAEGGAAVLTMIHGVPANIAASLDSKVEWRALQALAYVDGIDDARAHDIYRQLVARDRTTLTVDENIRLAELALRFNEPEQALPFAHQATDSDPTRTGAWKILVASLAAAGRVEEAERTYSLIPPAILTAAMSDPSFVDTVASLKEAFGDLPESRRLLEGAVSGSQADSNDLLLPIRLHLAKVLAKQGEGKRAEDMITRITEMNPNDTAAWRTRLIILKSLGRQSEIPQVAAKIPARVARRLALSGDYVSLLASSEEAAGDTDSAIRLLDSYIGSVSLQEGLPQRLQLGWMLLNSQARAGRLYSLLEGLNSTPDLSTVQKDEITKLWTTWILRSAEGFKRAGNSAKSLVLLEQGAHLYPNNSNIRRALAGELLSGGKSKQALALYANWGMNDAEAGDYAGAIGAALAERNLQYADAWVNRSLSLWPTKPQILELAGQAAQARGDLTKAERYWKEALAQRQAQPNDGVEQTADASASLEALLVNSGGGLSAQQTSFVPNDLNTGVRPVHEDFIRPSREINFMVKPEGNSPSDLLQDEIAALDSRDTPSVDSRITVWGRSGEPGLGRMTVEQMNIEGSRMLTPGWRLTFVVQPTFLGAGTAAATGQSFFGSATSAASFGPQSAGGVAGETQLSSETVGLRFGTTPQGFLIRNFVGGLRIQPHKGPFTLLLERDSVKDTLLSYAGARDPLSGRIWGGVVANTVALQGNWSGDRSGVYVNAGYQYLNGEQVASNRGITGGFGTWWKLVSLPGGGTVTAGMNVSALHYALNERYFTFGQGGYFSPQQYFLFNAPLRWSGVYNHRLQYIVDAAFGVQHFVEDPSDYYPADLTLQNATGYRYPALANTGPNFNVNARLNYQFAPHWLLGAFASANNARNYTGASVGVFAKYIFEERPMSFDNPVSSVPDWRGQQPFLIH